MSRRQSISLCDTAAIVAAVAKRVPKRGYPMSLPLGFSDAKVVQLAVNQGIDSRLEACFMPERGDSYAAVRGGLDYTGRLGNWLVCKVSAESLPVLVRRLLELDPEGSGVDGSDADHATSLASSICSTIGIDLT